MSGEAWTGLQGRTITVYCSSSAAVAPVYFEAARKLGRLLAENGVTLVYGGTTVGLMGALSEAARTANGKTVGIIPASLRQVGIADEHLSELIVTDGMRERKALMEARADAFIALPGGYGTLEEFFEIVTNAQLGFHRKPVVLLNINDYYGPLLEQMQRAVEQEFMKPGNLQLFYVAATPEAALEYLANYQPGEYEPKWFNHPTPQALGEQGEVPGTE
jgi:uncharacterized protein (TIGR00730 family)